MTPYIRHFTDPEIRSIPLGGKACSLLMLGTTGLHVPPWYALSPDYVFAFLESKPGRTGGRVPGRLRELGCSRDWDGVSTEVFADAGLKFQLDRDLRWVLGTPIGDNRRWAVRSSSRSEDGNEASHAGQLESFLNVATEDLAARVADVWTSGFSERLLAYRAEKGLIGSPEVPTVIIQEMVDAEWAGVAFGADPVSGSRQRVVISVVEGLGDKLVDGSETGYNCVVDREGSILEAPEAGLPPVPEGLLSEVADACRLLRQHTGRAQDVEWAWHSGRLYVLQSRPITTLGQIPESDGKKRLWDNSNISESYNGVTTPLTYSYARYIYEAVYLQFCRLLRVSEHDIESDHWVFANLLGLIKGRIYYNLPAWNRLLSMLPGFRYNRKFMEQMMGVREGLPAEYLHAIERASKGERRREKLNLLITFFRLFWFNLSLPKVIRSFDQRMKEALSTPVGTIGEMRADELADLYRSLERQLLKRWDAPLLNDFFAMFYFGALKRLSVAWLGEVHEGIVNDLVSGEGGMVSAVPAGIIRELAALAAEDPELLSLLEESGGDVLASLQMNPEFFRMLESYLERFGDRCMEELKLESPTLRDDPSPLLRSVATLARSFSPDADPEVPESGKYNARHAAEKLLRERLRNPFKRAVYSFVLHFARKRIRDRENLRLQRTWLFARVRLIFRELGRRFWEANRLDNPRDVFYLTVDELLGFVEGTSVSTDLKSLSSLRKAEFAEWAINPPSNRFETRGMVYVGNRMESGGPVGEASGDCLQGIPCYPGIVTGRVRLVTEPGRAEMEKGEILVAARTDPGWVILFPLASGLLVEYGSLLSHSAIVSRELGIPAVIAIPNLISTLQTGDLVEMDGASGRVTLIAREEA